MKNSKLRRALMLMACAVLLVCLSVGATLAYLTSTTEVVVNTFTVGNVTIKLDEAKVKGDGREYETDHDNRVLTNSYKLQPGLTYLKDPTVTVLKGSEECYVRMQVTVKNYASFETAFPSDKYSTWWNGETFLLQYVVDNWDQTNWPFQKFTKNTDGSATYEFWYKSSVAQNNSDNTVLDDLFESITLPQNMTNTELAALGGIEINVIAHAIQEDGFASQEAAWQAWDSGDYTTATDSNWPTTTTPDEGDDTTDDTTGA